MRPVAALALLSLTRSPAQAGELLRADVRADGSSLLRVEARNAGGAQEGSRAAALLEADLGSNASAPPEGVIYLYDETKRFTNEGWSSPNMMDTTDGKVHGPLGGHFTLVKTFKNLPPHSRVRVEVRYYALNNWALGGQGSVHIDGKIVWKGAAPKGCGEMRSGGGSSPTPTRGATRTWSTSPSTRSPSSPWAPGAPWTRSGTTSLQPSGG